MKLKVFNKEGKETSKELELTTDVFGLEPNDHVLYLDVKQHLAAKRSGTHKTKERGEVKGSTRKIKKQKGTGTARAGDIKNPIFRGGGRIFGPRPRKYGFKINKKVRSLARKLALSYKVQDKRLIVVEDFSYDTPKTKEFSKFLEGLGINGKSSLILLNEVDKNFFLSSRNLPKTEVLTANRFNAYEVLKAQYLIVNESGVKAIEESFKNDKS
ncbi:MAG: 50S ribosomal protein L4 [Chitinophagales bacterium]